MPEPTLSSTREKWDTDAQKLVMPVRVLIAHYLPHVVSGAENSIADLVDTMDPRFQCTMLVPGEGNLAQFYRKRGFSVWVRRVETRRRRYPGLHTLQSLLFARLLKQQRCNVVLANTFSAASRVGTAARMAGIPFGVYIREYISDQPAHREILDKADRIFTISKDLQGYIQSMTAHPEKVLLTYNHIQAGPIIERAEKHWIEGKRLLPFHPEHPVIGLIGRISRFKQQDLFVRMIPRVLNIFPDARFVIVGTAQDREKSYEDAVKQLAIDLGVQDKIAFMGQRRDIVEITAELTISCLTSTREPLGRVILEAGLVECPVVVPDIGGPSEIVENGVTGLWFSPVGEDAEHQLADQIIRLLGDEDLRRKLAQNAKEHMLNTFASPLYVKTQETYIEQLASL